MPITVRLVAQVHCDQPGCTRMDEAAERPTVGLKAVVATIYFLTAEAEFEARGWVFQPDGKTFCSDHYSTPRSPKP